jgi:hypothetical protein
MRCKYINWGPLLRNMGWPWKMMALLLKPNVIVIELLAPFQRWSLFKCYITSALICLPMHFEIVMFEQFWWPIYLVTPLWLTSWLSRITSNMKLSWFQPTTTCRVMMNPEFGSIQMTNPYKIFSPQKYIPDHIVLNSIGSDVHLLVNISCPQKWRTHLMGTTTPSWLPWHA